MPFDLQIVDDAQTYLDNLPLPDRAKESIWQFIDDGIRNIGDADRSDPENRPYGPGSTRFFRRFIFRVGDDDQRLNWIDFFVDDEHAAMGVLILVYVEHLRR